MITGRAVDALTARFPGVQSDEFRGQARVVVHPDSLHDVLAFLRDEHQFQLLIDITCVDYLHYRDATDRYGLVYLLATLEQGARVTVRTWLNDPDPVIATVTDLWSGADWLEREVWDMFGIVFVGHPDLRRILLPDQFTSHPLRKDYPLQGRGERHNFTAIRRGEA
ncbi:MAG: NADH-quinone oxidoreductase subunit C [Pirellulaceae bacterium]|nr:NADH-quinone oxidoreductase subunit C [Planctomycetales bacterium]